MYPASLCIPAVLQVFDRLSGHPYVDKVGCLDIFASNVREDSVTAAADRNMGFRVCLERSEVGESRRSSFAAPWCCRGSVAKPKVCAELPSFLPPCYELSDGCGHLIWDSSTPLQLVS